MEIEDTIFSNALPVNSNVMLGRLQNLLKENGTNCLTDCRDDVRVKKLMWLINSQVFGQLATIDMNNVWVELAKREGKIKPI